MVIVGNKASRPIVENNTLNCSIKNPKYLNMPNIPKLEIIERVKKNFFRLGLCAIFFAIV